MATKKMCYLLMVQKSGVYQLRLVVYPIIYGVLCTNPRWLFGIPSINSISFVGYWKSKFVNYLAWFFVGILSSQDFFQR